MANSLRAAALRDYLATADRHLASGNRVVIQQRQLVDELAHDGHDTREAVALLARFEELLAIFLSDRDRLMHELNLATT
jgi:hypothetical protein